MLHALLKGASTCSSLHSVWPRGHRDRRTELEEGGGCHRTLCSHMPSSSGWTGPWAAHLTPSSVTYHRTSQALPYHEPSVSSSVKRAVVPGRQSIVGTELTRSGNSQSSCPKGPDYPHPDSDRPAGHSKAVTTIFFKMAHRKPGHPLPPARGSAQLGSLTAPALLLRLRRRTRGLGKKRARGRLFCTVHIAELQGSIVRSVSQLQAQPRGVLGPTARPAVPAIGSPGSGVGAGGDLPT